MSKHTMFECAKIYNGITTKTRPQKRKQDENGNRSTAMQGLISIKTYELIIKELYSLLEVD